MLILARNVVESIYVGDDIRIKIVGVFGGLVTISIEVLNCMKENQDEAFEASSEVDL